MGLMEPIIRCIQLYTLYIQKPLRRACKMTSDYVCSNFARPSSCSVPACFYICVCVCVSSMQSISTQDRPKVRAETRNREFTRGIRTDPKDNVISQSPPSPNKYSGKASTPPQNTMVGACELNGNAINQYMSPRKGEGAERGTRSPGMNAYLKKSFYVW